MENYGAVSLTSIASKICEKILRKSIVNFWTDHQVFIGKQVGFMKKHSCLSQLLNTFHSWAFERNDSHKVDVILLDFTKAFDSVPHQPLLAKLKGYVIGENLLNWLTHFIVGRNKESHSMGIFLLGQWSPLVFPKVVYLGQSCSLPILTILQLG